MADGADIPTKMRWAQLQTRDQVAAKKLCRVNGNSDTTYVEYLQRITEDCGYPS